MRLKLPGIAMATAPNVTAVSVSDYNNKLNGLKKTSKSDLFS